MSLPSPLDDVRIRAERPLISPALLMDELPLEAERVALIAAARRSLGAILKGEEDRLIAVVGPCSIHDPSAALEYAEKLKAAADRHAEELLVVMRVYFEKPRTVIGWKGLINDPFLDGSFQINAGLRLARRLLLDVARLGLPAGTEFLDTVLGQYYADTVAWGAIGARTTESQVHRELASGLSMPVGFKNRTDGDIQVAIDALRSARHPHWFPSLTKQGAPAVLGTTGNDCCHLVLRGGSRSGPNHDAESVGAATTALASAGLPPFVMVDCSHGNSGKDPRRQAEVVRSLSGRLAAGDRAVCGVMIESHLRGGAQEFKTRPLAYGQSVTDPCLSWEETEPLLETLAQSVRDRRRSAATLKN